MQRDSTDLTVATGKGAKLTGGNATDEALASSRSILAPGRNGQARGTQQFFTPPAVSAWLASILGKNAIVFDPTAGNGALLSGFDPAGRYGVELDADQIAAANKAGQKYRASAADIQHMFPLLARVDARFPVVVCNPPFGLTWDVAGLAAGSSTLLGWRIARELLSTRGAGVLICGADRFDREIAPGYSQHFVARVNVAKLFGNVDLACTIALFVRGESTEGPECFDIADPSELTEDMADTIGGLLARAGFSAYLSSRDGCSPSVGDLCKAAGDEYRRRLGDRLALQRDTVEVRGGRLSSKASAFTQLSLMKRPDGRQILEWLASFDKQPSTWFALQTKEYARLLSLCDDAETGITLAKGARTAIEGAIIAGKRDAMPLYPVTPVQRLGFLADLDSIQCTTTDPDRGFAAGESYPITCATDVMGHRTQRVRTNSKGEEVIDDVLTERRDTIITIGDQTFSGVAESDLAYILGHFAVPDPGDVATRYPADTKRWRDIMGTIEAGIQALEPSFSFRWFQSEDIARLALKGRGLLGWEQGAGKALGLMAWVRALEFGGKLPDGCALFVMPQDLIPQFKLEAARFFGADLLQIDRVADMGGGERRGKQVTYSAVSVDRMVRDRRADLKRQRAGEHLAPRSPVWAVTHFEALSARGNVSEELPTIKVRRTREDVPGTPERMGWTDGGEWGVTAPATPDTVAHSVLMSDKACPECGATAADGWTGYACKGKRMDPGERRALALNGGQASGRRVRGCGYVHSAKRAKSAYAVLSRTFRAVCVDEATLIKGDESARSKALRAFQVPYRIAASGTPLKNYVGDLFWLLWWTLGDSSARFPYAYKGGQDRFEKDFGVFEYTMRGGRKGQGKPLPEVSNLLRLWRTLCGALVRRRIDEIGATVEQDGAWKCPVCQTAQQAAPWSDTKPDKVRCEPCARDWDTIAPVVYCPTIAPWGKAQKSFYARWLSKQTFANYFVEKHPDSPLTLRAPGMIPVMAAMLGQMAKLDYGCTDPMGDPDDYVSGTVSDLSHWTPGRLKILELCLEHARAGRKVLFGSCHKAVGPWVAARLNEAGIKAVHITDEDSHGKVQTKSAAQRAKVIQSFKTGDAMVLCVGVQAVNMGHNLDCASVAIVDGLPYDFATFDQFCKRVRRLTSKRPVTVIPIMQPGSLASRKWDLLKSKTKAADLALDGKLCEQKTAEVDMSALLAELQEKGIKSDGSDIAEADCAARWEAIKSGATPVEWTVAPAVAPVAKPVRRRGATDKVRKVKADKAPETPATPATLPMAVRIVTITSGAEVETFMYAGGHDEGLRDALDLTTPKWPTSRPEFPQEPTDPEDAILAELEADTRQRMALADLGCTVDRTPPDPEMEEVTEPVTERFEPDPTPAAPAMVTIESSNMAAVGYCRDDLTLRVEFRNGAAYEYRNVTRPMFEELIAAESHGEWLAANIKRHPDRHPYRQVQPAAEARRTPIKPADATPALAAVEALRAEQRREIERLRAENATLREKQAARRTPRGRRPPIPADAEAA